MHHKRIFLPDFTHGPIDIHAHINHGSMFDCPENEIHIHGLDYIENVYNGANVTQAGISTYASVLEHTECIPEENEYLNRLAEKKPWVYQWVVVDPRQPATFTQAEKLLSHPKVLGIKIHPGNYGYNLLDYADMLFAFADQNRAVVLMHPQHISKMLLFANQYPHMKLIIAHLGSIEHIDAIAGAIHGNIYTDTSGSASSYNNILEYAVQRVGSEKILFGTDNYSFAFQYGRIALSNIPVKDKENILWKNASRLFPEAFQTRSNVIFSL